MPQLEWTSLKFLSNEEYYETLGFLAKDENLVKIYCEDNKKNGAWAKQGRLSVKKTLALNYIPRPLSCLFNNSNELRVSESAYVEDLHSNHGFTLEEDPTGNGYTCYLHPISVGTVRDTVPERYQKDFDRGYHWDVQLIKCIRENATTYNLDNETAISGEAEGKKKGYYVQKYERSKKNRDAAIREHGLTCMICGFNYGDTYGELGEGYIEVHHIVPLSSRDEEVTVDPRTDMVCVCANCHRMLHRFKNRIIGIEEMINIYRDNKK